LLKERELIWEVERYHLVYLVPLISNVNYLIHTRIVIWKENVTVQMLEMHRFRESVELISQAVLMEHSNVDQREYVSVGSSFVMEGETINFLTFLNSKLFFFLDLIVPMPQMKLNVLSLL
jgi:hypothetical protein